MENNIKTMDIQNLAFMLNKFVTYMVGRKMRKTPNLDVNLVESILFTSINHSIKWKDEFQQKRFWNFVLKNEESYEFNFDY